MINEVLRVNEEEMGEAYLWLADTHDNIPDYNPEDPGTQGTLSPISSNWCSPFVGCTVEEVAAFIQAAPKPPKPLGKCFFAVLQKERFEQSKQLLIYKILDVENDGGAELKLQSVPCPVHLVGHFFLSWDRYFWNKAVQSQGLFYGHGYHWNDDDVMKDMWALVVLDDFPIEVRILIPSSHGQQQIVHGQWKLISPQTINEVLKDTTLLWLADTYETLPDYRPNYKHTGTSHPVSETWRSPFVGKSMQEVANFIRNTPKPPKPLCKKYFAVMQKELYEGNGELIVCKILPQNGELDQTENERDGAEDFRRQGRSTMCKITLDKSQMLVGDKDDSEDSEDHGEFEVQWVPIRADRAQTFFMGFTRSDWWEFGG